MFKLFENRIVLVNTLDNPYVIVKPIESNLKIYKSAEEFKILLKMNLVWLIL